MNLGRKQPSGRSAIHPLTTGVIEEHQGSYYKILPDVSPSHCGILVLLAILLILFKFLRSSFNEKNNHVVLLKSVIISGFCSYMFGWHVHEKAILTVIVPYSLLIVDNRLNKKEQNHQKTNNHQIERNFHLIACFGYLSLFGLFFTPVENAFKILLLATYFIWQRANAVRESKRINLQSTSNETKLPEISISRSYFIIIHKLLFIGIIPVVIFTEILHPIYFSSRYEFLDLMVLSVYCAIGLVYGFLEMVYLFLRQWVVLGLKRWWF